MLKDLSWGNPIYLLPDEQQLLEANWLTIDQAARRWGVSPRTARRYFGVMETRKVIVIVPGKSARTLLCVPADARPQRGQRGNPNFLSSSYQRTLAQRLRYKRRPYKRRRKED